MTLHSSHSTAALTAETRSDRTARWVRECREWARVPFLPSGTRVGRVYDIVGPRNLFGEDSLFINLGYWHDNPASLDEASRDLARLVAREARLGPDDIQLDIGFGYGDQDFLWAREFGPQQIIGMNIATEQIEIATRRAVELGLDDQISFEYGSAVDLPRPDESCTKVTALESAFHFPSYPRFFAEAFRVLQPGGLLVTADITMRNDLRRYKRWMTNAGFDSVRVYSIRDHVYPPLARYLGKRLRDPEMRRVNPLLRAAFSGPGVLAWGPWADYLIAVGTKH